MIVVRRRRGPIRLAEIYFPTHMNQLQVDADIAVITQASFRCADAEPFHTQCIDLRRSWEAIEADISKTARYKVRRATARDGVTVRIAQCPTASDIAGFEAAYAQFALDKDLRPFAAGRLTALAACSALSIATARLPDRTGVQHAYLCDGDRVRLFASVVDGVQSPASGRANRLLHVEVMRWARATGRHTYDLGGLALGQADLAGIDSFKQSFGGEQRTEWSWTQPLSRRGRLMTAVKGR